MKEHQRPLHIAIRTDFGQRIGMGHFVRMGALADAFEELVDAQINFYYTSDEPVDYEMYDIVILDTYLLSNEYIAELHCQVPLLVCCDDNALYSYDCDVILNANLHARQLCFDTAKTNPSLLLGGEYALLRREFWKTEPIEIKHDPSSIFICLGGTDHNAQTPIVVKALSMLPSLRLSVVLGRNAATFPELENNISEHISVYRDPASIAEIMKSCDIAVISAGSVVYEVAALGIPALTIVQADNQVLLAEYFDSHGLMQSVGLSGELDCQELINMAQSLLNDYNRRKKMSEKLHTSVDKCGALNAASKIIGVWNEIAQEN